jgi:hypothetical protein
VDDLAAAIRQIDRIDRAVCRREAEIRFDVSRMVDDYETVYEALVAGAQLT